VVSLAHMLLLTSQISGLLFVYFTSIALFCHTHTHTFTTSSQLTKLENHMCCWRTQTP